MIYHEDVFIRTGLETIPAMPTRINRDESQFKRSGTVTPSPSERREIFDLCGTLLNRNEDTNKAIW